LGLITSLALAATFAINRGVAIAKIGDELVLNYPFRSKRLALDTGITASAATQTLDAGTWSSWFRTPEVVVEKVTFQRRGHPDLSFRTALLQESANVIADRMLALAK